MLNQLSCEGCGLVSETDSNQKHSYMLSSPSCWKYYTKVLAKEYSNELYHVTNRLTVDTFALQHPGIQELRAIQSVNVHLASLYAVLVLQKTHEQATQLIDDFIKKYKGQFVWLEPPAPRYLLTIHDIWKENDNESYKAKVNSWALHTWESWVPHHEYISNLLKELKLI